MIPHYEIDSPDPYPDAVRIDGHSGIAWHVLGWETEPDEDTEWSGTENRTGRLVCVMVGDDRRWLFDPDEVHALSRAEYCGECGQIGCSHDGYSEDLTDDDRDRADDALGLGTKTWDATGEGYD